jgi:hypothetical protein
MAVRTDGLIAELRVLIPGGGRRQVSPQQPPLTPPPPPGSKPPQAGAQQARRPGRPAEAGCTVVEAGRRRARDRPAACGDQEGPELLLHGAQECGFFSRGVEGRKGGGVGLGAGRDTAALSCGGGCAVLVAARAPSNQLLNESIIRSHPTSPPPIHACRRSSPSPRTSSPGTRRRSRCFTRSTSTTTRRSGGGGEGRGEGS